MWAVMANRVTPEWDRELVGTVCGMNYVHGAGHSPPVPVPLPHA